MATKAFVLIETAVGKTKDVLTRAGQVPGVKSADPVTGPYDIVVVMEAETHNEVGNLVTTKIHGIPGITRTVTCLVTTL